MFAVRNNHAHVVKFLVRHGANLEKKTKCILPGEATRETALHWAIRQQNRKVCKLLIDAGADVEAESSLGSPLIYAIQGSEKTDKKIIALLLAAGASPISPSGRSEYRPIHIAAQMGEVSIIRLLCSAGAKPLPDGQSGKTPLMIACTFCNVQAAKVLLQMGDDKEARDNHGWTPLMHAAQLECDGLIQVLLRNGADVSARNKTRQTALDIAKSHRNQAGAYLLEKAAERKRRKRVAR